MAVRVRDFDPEYRRSDVDHTGYVTAEAYQIRNRPPPIKAVIAGEWWYLDLADVLSYERVAANRWNIATSLGSGHTNCPDFARLLGAP